DEDFEAIIRDRQGRRVNRIEPEQGLVLLKPTTTVPHGGGKRLEAGSADYRMFAHWLSQATPPTAEDPAIAKLQVLPASRIGDVGLTQQLQVVATYSNGASRDVTAWARYDSLDDALVSVTPEGNAKAIGRGQAGVMVRFEGQAAVATIIVPQPHAVTLADWQDQNFVDELARRKFVELGIEPSAQCDDATFLRRAYLDAVGTLPTPDETREFLASTDPKKREAVIERLLGAREQPAATAFNESYAAYWSIKWADLIRSSSDSLGEQGMWAMHNWIRDSLRANKPLDRFVRELITARGSIYRDGPANYYRINRGPEDLAESTAQIFLGVRLQCAKCHHHPFEKYSQDDYYGFAAFFARVATKNSQEFGIFGREQVVLVRSTGDVRHPKTRKVVPPTLLEGAAVESNAADPRSALAAWLTSGDNQFFARNVVNRYVAYLLGRGLVEPIDDMRATNPPSNAALMDALAADFIRSGYDVKHLMRTIMRSRLYQLSSEPNESNAADERFYGHYHVKRIAAEPLLDAVDAATGVQTKFRNLPQGTRAIELPDSNYPDYFLTTFGKPRRASVCECERVPDENLAQALHTLNGDTLMTKIANPQGRVAQLLKSELPFEDRVKELFLAAWCREPREEELSLLHEYHDSAGDEQTYYEDLFWTLLNSKQFLFVH
ncbi:MAG: DUF1553 domain-containing protein, partial [Planctomycetes bacterium]|nr:DUF1553 domain-containing protein [Planctomycetota bacterium]